MSHIIDEDIDEAEVFKRMLSELILIRMHLETATGEKFTLEDIENDN